MRSIGPLPASIQVMYPPNEEGATYPDLVMSTLTLHLFIRLWILSLCTKYSDRILIICLATLPSLFFSDG
jgi:hypothetical protein